jgi:hypothetical protein
MKAFSSQQLEKINVESIFNLEKKYGINAGKVQNDIFKFLDDTVKHVAGKNTNTFALIQSNLFMYGHSKKTEKSILY